MPRVSHIGWRRPHIDHTMTWIVVGVVVVAAALAFPLRGKDDRAARRELLRLRSKERSPTLRGRRSADTT